MKWNRRQFLKVIGAASGLLPGLKWVGPVRAAAGSRRILVIVELNGGNDGLNTVVPYVDGHYFDARPNLSLDPATLHPLSGELALHGSLEAWLSAWEAGSLAVALGVGYPEPDLSHFRSTDIWRGGDTGSVIRSGWLGRYLELRHGNANHDPSPHPYAIEVRDAVSLVTRGEDREMGVSMRDPEFTAQLTRSVIRLTEVLPDTDTPGGDELAYVQALDSQAAAYADAVYEAWSGTGNQATYPETGLARDLSTVARMIGGGLLTEAYVVGFGSFDTHVNQLGIHASLLAQLAESVSAFLEDLRLLGVEDEVIVMTMSEFGRRLQDNGSGTDHGTAAPLFVAGAPVHGGLVGDMPDLTDLDEAGNLRFTTDYRRVYAGILTEWFGMTSAESDQILNGPFEPLALVGEPHFGNGL